MNILSTTEVNGLCSAMATKARLEANLRWQLANPDKYRAAIKAWKDRNPDKGRASSNKWKEAHPEYAERRRELERARRKADPEKKRQYDRAYYAKKVSIGRWSVALICQARHGKTSKKYGAPTVTVQDLEDLWVAQDGKCCWSGAPLNAHRRSIWKVSLDRIDCSAGYTKENVQLSSWFMNRARGNLSVEEFKQALSVFNEHFIIT